jgi:DNA-binding HxlR family transcriptional regulator
VASCKHYPSPGPSSGRPIDAAVEMIGDRWSLLVLRDVTLLYRLARECDPPH